MDKQEIDKIQKAGKIAIEVKSYAKSIVKKGMPLLELAEKIEGKIIVLGGKPAFPVNLGINEYAAHYTPSYEDLEIVRGLLKIDLGVSVNGFVADTAFSLDFEDKQENKNMIKASELALDSAIKSVSEKKTLGEVGFAIQTTGEKFGFSSVKNLSGHEIKQYNLHAGITIPNYDNKNNNTISDGIYAIEPFITSGVGEIYEGAKSGIYKIKTNAKPRDNREREVMEYINNTYKTLPFCSRWLVKKFGTKVLLSLKILENSGIIHNYPHLIERSKKPVAQSEDTILIINGKVEIISKQEQKR
jgi:methionyl aminopeptidase